MGDRRSAAGARAAAGAQVHLGVPTHAAVSGRGRAARAAASIPTPPRRSRARTASGCYALTSATVSGTRRSSRRRARSRARSASRGTSSSTSICAAFGGSALTTRRAGAEGSAARSRRTFRPPTSRRATRCSCRWRWLGRSAGRARHLHRRQRARLLGLSRLPARSSSPPSSSSRAGDASGRRGRALSRSTRRSDRLTKADIIRRGLALGLDYGLTHSCYDPAPTGGRAAAATAASCAPPALPRPGVARSRRSVERHDRAPLLHRAFRRSFDAVVSRASSSMKARPAVVLDRTAFYPTSGGQPFDIGRSGRRRRRHIDDEDGDVVHVVARRRWPPATRFTARSTGRGGSITCSSTPGSTCCRPRSIGCSTPRP